MCATLCSLNQCILFSVFYVLPFGVINDDDDDDDNTTQNSSDNLPSYLQTNIIAEMLSIGGERDETGLKSDMLRSHML